MASERWVTVTWGWSWSDTGGADSAGTKSQHKGQEQFWVTVEKYLATPWYLCQGTRPHQNPEQMKSRTASRGGGKSWGRSTAACGSRPELQHSRFPCGAAVSGECSSLWLRPQPRAAAPLPQEFIPGDFSFMGQHVRREACPWISCDDRPQPLALNFSLEAMWNAKYQAC